MKIFPKINSIKFYRKEILHCSFFKTFKLIQFSANSIQKNFSSTEKFHCSTISNSFQSKTYLPINSSLNQSHPIISKYFLNSRIKRIEILPRENLLKIIPKHKLLPFLSSPCSRTCSIIRTRISSTIHPRLF